MGMYFILHPETPFVKAFFVLSCTLGKENYEIYNYRR